MFNKVVLVGNLTRDIELRYLQNGTAIGKSAIAVTRKFNGANGEKREETCFIDIDFFGRTAEVANQYLKKGSKVLIEGRLRFDQWQDQNGQNRSKHGISVENMEMLGSPQGGNFQNNQNNSQNYGNSNSYGNSGYNNYNNQNNGYSNNQNSYSGQNSNYGNSNYQKQNDNFAPKNNDYNENIPELDVDADKYDSDDSIPF